MSDKFEIVIDGLWRKSIKRGVKFKHPVTQREHIIGPATDDEYIKTKFNAWPRVSEIKPTPNLKLFNKPKLIRTVDTGNEVVNFTYEVTAKPIGRIRDYCRDQIIARVSIENAKDFDLGNGVISNRAEMRELSDLLDGSEGNNVNFDSGHKAMSVSAQNTARQTARTRHKAIHARAFAIRKAVKDATSKQAKINALENNIDTGWPA